MIKKVPFFSNIRPLKKLRERKFFSLHKMKVLKKDTVEIVNKPRSEMTRAEKVMQYKANKNMNQESLLRNKMTKKGRDFIRQVRSGDVEARNKMDIIIKAVEEKGNKVKFDNDFDDYIARIYYFSGRGFPNEAVKCDPLEYSRIYRAIGKSELDALKKGEHIVSGLRETGVDVTNSPKGVAASTNKSGGVYFITFKDKDNFDPFLSHFYDFDKNFVPNVQSKNRLNAEYILEGGYDLSDVESIKDIIGKKIIYSNK